MSPQSWCTRLTAPTGAPRGLVRGWTYGLDMRWRPTCEHGGNRRSHDNNFCRYCGSRSSEMRRRAIIPTTWRAARGISGAGQRMINDQDQQAASALFDWVPDEQIAAVTQQFSEILPELVIGMTRPQGTNDKHVLKRIKENLEAHHYLVEYVQVADLIERVADELSGTGQASKSLKGHARIIHLMQWGDDLRQLIDPSVAAMLAIFDIYERRGELTAKAKEESRVGVAYVVRNLMHPLEVSLLRSVYKQRFFLVGVQQDSNVRIENLKKKLIEGGVVPQDADEKAREILTVDAGFRSVNEQTSSGASLSINKTFHQADVFVRADEVADLEIVTRWLRQVFGNPFGTPTPPELGMAAAFLAARSSASLGRSVGAAIVDKGGSLTAIGWNDVAKPHGGLFREGDNPDGRDHIKGSDPSDGHRIEALTDFLRALIDEDWTEEEWKLLGPDARVWLESLRRVKEDVGPVDTQIVRRLPVVRSVASTRLLNLIEFGRSVHAEMAAITDAARRGVSTQDCTLYVTTFPCHECTRNIVAAGITAVYYVEPYAKSMASDLYDDLVKFPSSTGAGSQQRVTFDAYSGISPKRFDEVFSAVARKYSLGEVAQGAKAYPGDALPWSETSSALRSSIRGYVNGEAETDPHFEVAKRFAEESAIRQLVAALTEERASFEVAEKEIIRLPEKADVVNSHGRK